MNPVQRAAQTPNRKNLIENYLKKRAITASLAASNHSGPAYSSRWWQTSDAQDRVSLSNYLK